MDQRWKPIVLYVFLLVCTFLPMFTAVPYLPWERGFVMIELFVTTTLLYPLWLRIALHIAILVLLALLIFYGYQLGRIADAFFGVLFLFYAFFQNITITPTYGLVILTGNMVMLATLGLLWLWEAFRPQNEYTFHRLSWWRYWPIPFLVLAYWFPYGHDLLPDFNPLFLLTSDFGVTFCATAPLIIALLTWIYPSVNRRLLTATSLVGFIIGIFNILAPLTMPGYTLWMLFLHTPLIFISFYGLILPLIIKDGTIPHES